MIKKNEKYSEALNINQLKYLSKMDLNQKYSLYNPFLCPKLKSLNIAISGYEFAKDNIHLKHQNTCIKCFAIPFLIYPTKPYITIEKAEELVLKANDPVETFKTSLFISSDKKQIYFLLEFFRINKELLAKLKLTNFYNVEKGYNQTLRCSIKIPAFSFDTLKEFCNTYLNTDDFKNADIEITFELKNLKKNYKNKKEFLTLFKHTLNLG